MSSRNYCFTIYSNTDASLLSTEELLDKDNQAFVWTIPMGKDGLSPFCPNIKFIVYQKEVAPTTGRHHYQGYVEFNKPMTRKQCQSLLGVSNCHVEKRREVYDDGKSIPKKDQQRSAIAYCSKEATRVLGTLPFTWGVQAKQGNRSDIKKTFGDSLKNVNSSTSIDDFAKENPLAFVKYHTGIEKLIFIHRENRTEKTYVIIIWGQSNTAKTRFAYDLCKKEGVTLFDKQDPKWWDGYDNQHTVLLDDYEGEFPFCTFIKMIDRYNFTVQVKGGTRKFNPKRIIITSNNDPRTWYDLSLSDKRIAFSRRIEKVYHYKYSKKYEDVEFYKLAIPRPDDEKNDEELRNPESSSVASSMESTIIEEPLGTPPRIPRE